MAKAVKLEDIAKRVGVSSVTVSKALSDKSGVSEEVRAKIKEMAAEMGYIPISSQKARERRGTGNIGIIISERFVGNNTSFYWTIYQNLVTILQVKDYYAILEIIDGEAEEQCSLPKVLQDEKVDGIIVIGQVNNHYSEFIWKNKQVPVVFLDFYDTHMEYDTVISDGFYGMYVLTDYLIKLGHKEIGFVGTPLATSSITDRYFGYQKALLENGIEVHKEWIIEDRDLENVIHKIELPKKLPTAFACNNDFIAEVMIKLLEDRGLKVPEHASVVGFDNYLYTNIANANITTYDVDRYKMAEMSAKTLLRKINHKDYVKGVQIVTGHMIIKETTGKRK